MMNLGTFSAAVLGSILLCTNVSAGPEASSQSREMASGGRAALIERAIAIAEAAVANPGLVSGAKWDRFKETIRDPQVQSLEDTEFRQAFNAATESLPFTHLRLHTYPQGNSANVSPITLDWPSEDVALVRVGMFDGDPSIITNTMNEVIEKQPANLIVDLRGNSGGSFPTAVALSSALRRDALDAGAFLTRGWFQHHEDYPGEDQYAAIKPLEVLDLSAFAAQLKRDGAARLVLPAHNNPIFEGRVVLLTDTDTASTCEPLVYLLQQGGSTVIGERTAGAMLSAEHFPLDDTFRLFVPVADYVTPDLVRLDRRGVEPDIVVPGDQALERALEFLVVQG